MSTSLEVTKGMTTVTALNPILYRDTAPKFPPETFDAIIDRVHTVHVNDGDDKVEKLLGVCSLVCKSWIPRSRYHLFQWVVMENAKPFLDLLDSPLCTFKPYVELIQLNGSYNLEDALPRFSKLPAVRDLVIYEGLLTSPNLAKILSNFQNLQRLVLDGCFFRSPAQLRETLSMCKLLKSLSLFHLEISHSDLPTAVTGPPAKSQPPSLRFVRIYDTRISDDIMEWLVSGEQVPAIETLDISLIQNDKPWTIGHCLQRLGPSLKNLRMDFIDDIFHKSQNVFLYDVDLSHNTNLHSIVFRSCLVQIPSLLPQVTSSEVREVVVDVAWATVERLRHADWDTIARILDRPNFSKLEKLIIPSATDVDEVRHWMIQRLPPGRARDKLILYENLYGDYPGL